MPIRRAFVRSHRYFVDLLVLLPLYGVEDFLGVLDPPGHFVLLRLEDVGEDFVGLFAALAGEEDCLFGSVEEDLAVVEEVDLKELVAEAEHDGVARLEPLLDEDEAVVLLVLELLLGHVLHLLVEVDHEPLQEHVLLLEVAVLGHALDLVALDVLLLEGGVFDEVDVPAWMDAYCLF